MMTRIEDKIGEDYVRLSFALDKLLGKGKLVDSFYGDKKIISDVSQQNPKELKYNLENLREIVLKNLIDTKINPRRTFLVKQIDALIKQIEIFLENKKIHYFEAIKTILDIDLKTPDKNKIEDIKQNLAFLLKEKGYKGDLFKMVNEYRANGIIDFKDYLLKTRHFSRKFKRKSFEILSETILSKTESKELYKKSKIKYKIVDTNEAWSAYNYYNRNYSGSVVFNSSGNFELFDLQNFVSHESYPGHHTSGVIREYLYNSCILNAESSVHLLNTPESTIAEGIGDSAIYFINENLNDIDLKIGITLSDLSVEAVYKATIDFYVNGLSDSQIIKNLSDDKLYSEIKNADRSLNFIKNWGYYVPSYKYGKEIVMEQYLKHGKNIFKSIYSICNPTILNNFNN